MLIFSLFNSIAFAQDFNCTLDGYIDNSGGGIYSNIDGSGIDLAISGLVNDFCSSSYIYTGLNDGQNTGQIDVYQFTFSENVDVQFSILDINQNLSSNYYDFLLFSGSPDFSNSQFVTIIGDSVLPPATGWSGTVTVSYNNISSFSITHGDGITSNPGYIMISNILINNFLSTNIVSETPGIIIGNGYIKVSGNHNENPKFSIFDMLGKEMNPNFSYNDGLIIYIDDFPNGSYYIIHELSGVQRRERFIILK